MGMKTRRFRGCPSSTSYPVTAPVIVSPPAPMGSRLQNRNSAYNGSFGKSSATTSERTVKKANGNTARPARLNEHVSLSNRSERMQLSGGITKMTGIEVPADVRRVRGARFAGKDAQTASSSDGASNSMEVSAKGKGATDRRRGGRRLGRGGARGRGGRKPLTKDNLDSELDSYMLKDETTGKNILDKELDAYMHDIAPNANSDL